MYKFLCREHSIKPQKLRLTPEEEKMKRLIPTKKAKGMLAEMELDMDPDLPQSHEIFKYPFAAWELANFIDGKRTMLEIAQAVPLPEKSAEFFYNLAKKEVIELKKK